jgi:molybdate transport system substrate-binding protein
MYTAGLTTRAAHPVEAAALIALLAGADHRDLRQRVGFAG